VVAIMSLAAELAELGASWRLEAHECQEQLRRAAGQLQHAFEAHNRQLLALWERMQAEHSKQVCESCAG
jgi:hypothetical protein